MIDFNFNPTVGYVLDKTGDVTLIDGVEALRQSIANRLQFFKGEWFLDTTAGLAYTTSLRSAPVDPALIAVTIKDEVLKEDEVTQVLDISVKFDALKRLYTYSFTVKTVYDTDDIVITGTL